MNGELIHFEIPADDVQKIADFYRNVLGWKIESSPEFEGYLMVTTSGREDAVEGGIMKKQMPQQTGLNYYEVDSIEDFNSKVKENGGQVLMEKMPVPKMGFFSVCLDPEGNPVGSWLTDENAS